MKKLKKKINPTILEFTFPKNMQIATKENYRISVFHQVSDSIFNHGKRTIFRKA